MHAQKVFVKVASAISNFEQVTVCASAAQVGVIVEQEKLFVLPVASFVIFGPLLCLTLYFPMSSGPMHAVSCRQTLGSWR